MTEIGSDLFKIPHNFNHNFFADSESEIRFSKKNQKKSKNSQKPKKTRFLIGVFRPKFLSKSKKIFFSNSALSLYPEKMVLKKIKN